MTVMSRKCSRCKKVFPLWAFPKNKNGPQGRLRMCRKCHNAYGKRWKENTPQYLQLNRRQNGVEQRRRRRLIILERYGGKCDCCGEARTEFLSIAHTEGDGREEREKLGGSSYIWRRLYNTGPARTLSNLGRLAPGMIGSYIGLRDVACGDSRRADHGEGPAGLFGGDPRVL